MVQRCQKEFIWEHNIMHVYTFLILSTVFVCESSSWSGGVSLSPCPGRSTAITWWSCDKFWKWRKLFIIKKYKKYSITMVYKWTSIWKWKIILTSCKKTRNSIMYNYNWWSYWPIKNDILVYVILTTVQYKSQETLQQYSL